MTRFRVALLGVLFGAPFAFLVGAGGYHLWAAGWILWAWAPMLLCFALAYFLAGRWTKRPVLHLSGQYNPFTLKREMVLTDKRPMFWIVGLLRR
mgnify:CR=1 FL=1